MKHNHNHPATSRVEEHQALYHKDWHFWRWVISILLVIVIALASYSAYLFFQAKKAADQTYDPKTAVHIPKGEFNGKKPFAVLLMGTDTGALGRRDKKGNTDTMIIAVVNPRKKRYSLVSIPRDTMAQMVGAKNFATEKINAAYPLGGAKMAMASVSRLVGVPIRYYALVNMGGIMKMIKYVGGVVVDPPLTFTYNGQQFKKGRKRRVMGYAALAYSRMRYDDPRGDYGREERQREVITKMIKKAVSLESLKNLDTILTSVSGNVRTNLPFSSLRAIALNYRRCSEQSHSDYLHGVSATIDDSSYQVQPTKELQRVSDYLRRELGLKPQKLHNNETYQNQMNAENGFDFAPTKVQKYHIYDYDETGDN